MKKLLYTLFAVSIIFSACEEDTPAPSANNNNNNNSISGCTNSAAPNYDASAVTDDGSCILPPQLQPGLQLGDFHLDGTIFYLDGLGGGMVFKNTMFLACNYSPSFNWTGLCTKSTNTLNTLGSGEDNTINMYNNHNTISMDYGLNTLLHNCFSFGWHIPSLDEVVELYNYGTEPYWDSINHPGEIRGWGYGYSMTFGNETYTTYGNEAPGQFLGSNIISSSQATTTEFYAVPFISGNPAPVIENKCSINFNVNPNTNDYYYRLIGVKYF